MRQLPDVVVFFCNTRWLYIFQAGHYFTPLLFFISFFISSFQPCGYQSTYHPIILARHRPRLYHALLDKWYDFCLHIA